VCWALAGFAAAWALSRLFGLEFGFPLVPLMAYTPYAAVGAAVAAAGCAAMRQWRPAILAGVSALLLIALILPRALPGPGPEGSPDGPTLNLMSTNLRIGQGDIATVLGMVREENIDVLAIQELTVEARVKLERAGIRDLLPRKVDARNARSGFEGSAIYTRLAAAPAEQVDESLPVRPVTLVAPDGTRFDFVNVHPSLPQSWSAVNDWREAIDAMPHANPGGELRIVAGDFNATLDTDELRDLIATGYTDAADAKGKGLTPTYVGRKSLPVTIDHVLVDRRIGVESYDLKDVPESDHRTLIVEVRLP
jgi:endonuclease/exonuclease/phosphatase (EEP) superfamily protein YafD